MDGGFWQTVFEFVRENEVLVEVIVFILGFAESLVFVSFFVPASVLFLAIAGLHSAVDGPFLPLLVAGAAGCLAGDIVSFAIGWRVRKNVRRWWPFTSRPDLLARMRLLFGRHCSFAILVSKFVGPFRPVAPVFAGAMRMGWVPFVGASAASSLAWAAAFLAPAYYGIQLLG